MYDQSLGEIPMVEDELRKAAGTEENVDESLAAGPTQQVRFSFDVSTQKLLIQILKKSKARFECFVFSEASDSRWDLCHPVRI